MKRTRDDEKYNNITSMFCFNNIEYYWLITSLNTNYNSIEMIDVIKKSPSRYITYLDTINFDKEHEHIKFKLENYLINFRDNDFYQNFIEMKNIDDTIYNLVNHHNPPKRLKSQ